MTKTRTYQEDVLPFKGDPLILATQIVRLADPEDYLLYENQGEWSLGMGIQDRLTMYADRIEVSCSEEDHVFGPNEDLSQAIQNGLDLMPVSGWRAYGTATFELSRLLYGLSVSNDSPLIKLFIPKEEVRIDDAGIRVRALDAQRLAAIRDIVEQAISDDSEFKPPSPLDLKHEVATHSAEEYKTSVANALKELHSQQYRKVILSRQIALPHTLDMAASYVVGRRANTPSRSYLLRLDGLEAAGFSPETMAEVTPDGETYTTPLAGTRAIGEDIMDELRLREELVSDSKEIAEHAISVYVGFDELTMVCDPSTVSVVNFMIVSRRGAVQHLASRLNGKLLRSCSPWHAFNALFPAVTASGVPKRESVDAIGRFEAEPRGLYAGCVMVCDDVGMLDAALVLRSFYQRADKTWIQAGAGIMNMSRPERELEETVEKLTSVSRYLVAAE